MNEKSRSQTSYQRWNMFDLEGRVVVITGAGNGLGKEYAGAFARAGARVAVADIEEAAASKVAKGIVAAGGESIAISLDVTNEESTLAMASEVTRTWGTLNVLINCAARILRSVQQPLQPFDKLPLAEWDLTFAVNARGPWLCSRAVVPAMKAAGGGKIINFSSGTFYTGAASWCHYAASKGAVVGLTRSLARELGPDNIAVNTISPSLTMTDATEKLSTAYADRVDSGRCFARRQMPNDLIGTVLFLSSSHSDFITGQTINVDGGIIMT
jgi:3-oxoacyl-[acyl-carrier protein] reductase